MKERMKESDRLASGEANYHNLVPASRGIMGG